MIHNKKYVTKKELAKMIAAFCDDDIEYIKNEMSKKSYDFYNTHYYTRYTKKLSYYAITNISEKTLEYLLSNNITSVITFDIYEKLIKKQRLETFFAFLSKKTDFELNILFTLNYSEIITYFLNRMCIKQKIDSIGYYIKLIDSNRFDCELFISNIQYTYQNNKKAAVFFRKIKLEALQKLIN